MTRFSLRWYQVIALRVSWWWELHGTAALIGILWALGVILLSWCVRTIRG